MRRSVLLLILSTLDCSGMGAAVAVAAGGGGHQRAPKGSHINVGLITRDAYAGQRVQRLTRVLEN